MPATLWMTSMRVVAAGACLLVAAACDAGAGPATTEPDDQVVGDAFAQLEGHPMWVEIYREMAANKVESFRNRMGQPPPADAEFVRFIDHADYGRVLAGCVQEAGFYARELPDGGVKYGGVPEDQTLAKEEAIYRCEVAYPTHPRHFEPWTDERAREIYDYHVNHLIDCLEAEGYPMIEPPPSFETYLATYRSGTTNPWHPYSAVFAVSDRTMDEWWHVNEVCPQYPPSE